jgi:uncharacterized protein (TIGR00730 family)
MAADHLTRISICVFCGISTGNSPRYLQAAHELGELIGEHGHRLIYGAGGVGMMGALARGAASCGAEILGVIPQFLRAREMSDHLPRQNLIITDGLLTRKRVMIERSDAFIALPGGYGTLDEILEIISMSALGLKIGPLVLVDVADYWAPLSALTGSLLHSGFIRRTDLYRIAKDVTEAVDMVTATVAPVPHQQVPDRSPATVMSAPTAPARSVT